MNKNYGSVKIFIAALLFLFLCISTSSAQQEKPDTLVSLEAVEIIGHELKEQAYPVRQLRKLEIEVLPVFDIGQILRSMPNVSGIRKGGAVVDPVIRGFKYSQLNVQLNSGQKIEGGCPNRMDPATAHVDIEDIRAIEVIKGPFALRYGPNFGGVVNMKTLQAAPGREFNIHVGAMMGYESNWNGWKQRLTVNGGNDKVFFALSGNRKTYNNYTDGKGEEVRSAFNRYNYSAQLGVSPFRNNYLLISYDRSFGRDVLFPALPMDEREDNTHLASIDYKAIDISSSFKEFKAKFYVSDVSHLMDNKQRPFSDTVVAVSDIQARNYGYRLDGSFLFGNHELVTGTDYEHILKDGTRTKARILEPTMPVMLEDLWNDAQIQNNGLYILYRRAFEKLVLDAAVRLDINRANSAVLKLVKMGNLVYEDRDVGSQFVNLSASAGLQVKINSRLNLGFSLGRGVRSPDMTERFIMFLPIGYDNYDYLGNPGLKPEANHEADISLKLGFPEAGTIEGAYFFSYVSNYITARLVPESVARPQTKGVYGVKQFYNEDFVYLRGFELTYHTPEAWKLGLRARMACTRGINPETTRYIIEDGEVIGDEEIKNDPLPEIPPLEGSLDVFYTFCGGRFTPNLNIRAVAPQKDISLAYLEDETPGFLLLNFNFSYRFSDYMKLTGGVSNTLDKAYYEHLNRRIIGGAGNLYEPGRIMYLNVHFKI